MTCSTPEAAARTVPEIGGSEMTRPASTSGSSESTAGPVATTSTLPLRKAHDRLLRAEQRGKPERPPPLRATFRAHVATMAAEGLPIRAIATGLHVSPGKVKWALALPETQLDILKRRELAKQIAAHSLPSITAKGYALAEASAAEGDARSFDAATRGLHALEKIGASVSGEDRKMQVVHSGQVEMPQTSAVEQLRVLIGVIVGAPAHPR